MPDFYKPMLRLERAIRRPKWTDKDWENYDAWEAANLPRLSDHVRKLWRGVKSHRARSGRARRK